MANRNDAQLERVTNLTFAFLSAAKSGTEHVTFDYVYKNVPGYKFDDKKNLRKIDAAHVMFQRDCRNLIRAGVPLESFKLGSQIVWRLQPENYELPAIEFTPDEVTVLGLAGKMGTGDQLAAFSRSGWTKIAASGVESSLSPSVPFTPINDWSSLQAQDLDLITEACAHRKRLSFYYQRTSTSDYVERWMDPWGIVSNRDRLYLVGFDLDRGAPRCFRITRISDLAFLSPKQNDEETYGGFHEMDPSVDLHELVLTQLRHGRTLVDATIRASRAQAVAIQPGAIEIDSERGLYKLVDIEAGWLVRQAAALAPEVVVVEPQEIVDSVVKLLRKAADGSD